MFPDHAAFNRDFLRPESPVFGAHIGIPDPGFFAAASPERRNGRMLFAKSGWNTVALERQFRATLPDNLASILFAAVGDLVIRGLW